MLNSDFSLYLFQVDCLSRFHRQKSCLDIFSSALIFGKLPDFQQNLKREKS